MLSLLKSMQLSSSMNFKLILIFCFGFLSFVSCESNYTNTPVVFWHGMGDSCCFPFSLGYLKKLVEKELNNTIYVKSFEIGGNYFRDYESSYFIHPNKQIEDVCDQVKNDKYLNGTLINAVGFSQGSQFLRGLIQRCPYVKVKNLITLGGQHQGVFGLPNCPTLTQRTCEYIRQVLNYAAYAGWLQRSLVQASYWHDPLNEDVYKQKSSFLADINNELKRNNKYIQRLQSLNKFVMIKFVNDTIVVPTETSHFGFYKSGSDKETITMEETELYIKDKLGLKKMKEEGKLEFKSIEGNHMQITSKYFIEEVVRPYLKDSNENESIQSSTQSTTETTETTTNVSNITNSTIPE